MFAQQAGAPYLDAGQAAQNFTATTTPGAVTSGQTFLQVTPAGTTMQAQRHPITHTTRASPATVSSLLKALTPSVKGQLIYLQEWIDQHLISRCIMN